MNKIDYKIRLDILKSTIYLMTHDETVRDNISQDLFDILSNNIPVAIFEDLKGKMQGLKNAGSDFDIKF